MKSLFALLILGFLVACATPDRSTYYGYAHYYDRSHPYFSSAACPWWSSGYYYRGGCMGSYWGSLYPYWGYSYYNPYFYPHYGAFWYSPRYAYPVHWDSRWYAGHPVYYPGPRDREKKLAERQESDYGAPPQVTSAYHRMSGSLYPGTRVLRSESLRRGSMSPDGDRTGPGSQALPHPDLPAAPAAYQSRGFRLPALPDRSSPSAGVGSRQQQPVTRFERSAISRPAPRSAPSVNRSVPRPAPRMSPASPQGNVRSTVRPRNPQERD